MQSLILEICDCPSAFSFASPKENAGKRKRARRDFDFPPDLLEPTKKTASVFLDLSRDSLKSNANPYCPMDFIRRTFCRKYSNVTAIKSGVSYQAARTMTFAG